MVMYRLRERTTAGGGRLAHFCYCLRDALAHAQQSNARRLATSPRQRCLSRTQCRLFDEGGAAAVMGIERELKLTLVRERCEVE